jgi:hypothetical protein
MTYSRFDENDRPIPEPPAEFAVVLDEINDLPAGPYMIDITNAVRLRCRFGPLGIVIDSVEVQDYSSHQDWASEDTRPQWSPVGGTDHMTWLITDLIRARYATPEKQAWLRQAASRLLEDEEDEG